MGILSKCFGGSSSSTSRKQPSATVEDLCHRFSLEQLREKQPSATVEDPCHRFSVEQLRKKQPSATVEDICHRFSLEQLRKSTDNFDKSRLIVETDFSKEYRASISVNGELKHVTVKRLRLEALISSYDLICYKNNIIFRCQLHHPNLVSLVGFCDDHNEMIVVFDYAPKGSLHHQLCRTERNSPTLSWKRRLEISIGVARALHYLHSGTKRTIIHLDIRPASILLDENWVPKLKFSGISVKGPKFSEKEARPVELKSVAGTRGYVAPENSMNAGVTHKCDVYSFGALLLDLISGKDPCLNLTLHQVGNVKELRNWVETGNGEGIIDESLVGEIAPQCWELYMEITESCLSEDPNERPDMGEVEVQLEHVLQLQDEADTNRAS
ncbi:hypothetical protein QN277_011220 [Acacia crassicarpa]|uniref:Protein kinase domain-containing protein n=1 Tax=Acacia crassicarpa TaxID=499986 RepID=A0AAE1MXY8_9FABA|nr:hypothetical protein QN277_011220 [Acacia crassicarpa]